MEHLDWTSTEKRVARSVFEKALQAELAEVLYTFKVRAAAVKSTEEMWAIREYLQNTERDIDAKYEYRYSQLPFVFGRLLREGRIQEEELRDLDEQKLQHIRRIASL